jgi:hypothetical protein
MHASEQERANKTEISEQHALWAKAKLKLKNEAKDKELDYLKARKVDIKNAQQAVKAIFEVEVDSDEAKQTLECFYYDNNRRSVKELENKAATIGRKFNKFRPCGARGRAKCTQAYVREACRGASAGYTAEERRKKGGRPPEEAQAQASARATRPAGACAGSGAEDERAAGPDGQCLAGVPRPPQQCLRFC